jgi:hypothetical protein
MQHNFRNSLLIIFELPHEKMRRKADLSKAFVDDKVQAFKNIIDAPYMIDYSVGQQTKMVQHFSLFCDNARLRLT